MKYLLLFSLLIFSISGCNPTPEDHRPNVILILADDLGYGDLGCYGSEEIKTPNIDKLANQGVHFTQFYSNGPECTPTRAALLSGLYQQRIGGLECAIGAGNVGRYDEAKWLSDQRELGLPPEFSVLPRNLKLQGYNTTLFGKWHLGYDEKFRPDKQGFDHSLGPLGYGGDYFYHVEQAPIRQDDFSGAHNLALNGSEIFRDGEYMTDIITKEAISWLTQQDDHTPFFLYIPFTAPHSPYQGPDDDIGRPILEDEWKFKSREKFIEMTESMDNGIGEILQHLEEMELARETIVIFFSDNGGNGQGNNGILSGYKGHVWEGGIRVPCIIRWPGNIEAGKTSSQVAISFDITCSLLNLCGSETESIPLDGYDIINHIISDNADKERTLYWRNRRGKVVKKAVRHGDNKYLVEFRSDTIFLEGMYNLKEDRSEKNNHLDIYPEKADSLKSLLQDWEQEVKAKRLSEFLPATYPLQ